MQRNTFAGEMRDTKSVITIYSSEHIAIFVHGYDKGSNTITAIYF